VQRLQVIVDKTAGPHELEAMALLADHIRNAVSHVGSGFSRTSSDMTPPPVASGPATSVASGLSRKKPEQKP
jgi:hypothetical protein